MTIKALERQAIRAHARGERWTTFWGRVAADVARAEPYDLTAYRKLVRKLLGLLVRGDTGGAEPVVNGWSEPCPWELDDEGHEDR